MCIQPASLRSFVVKADTLLDKGCCPVSLVLAHEQLAAQVTLDCHWRQTLGPRSVQSQLKALLVF